MKTCYHCKEEFPATREFFYYKSGRSDGLASRCIECKRKYNRERYHINAEKRKAQGRKWRENNKEHIEEYQKENREKILARQKRWREKNKEHIRKYRKEWAKNKGYETYQAWLKAYGKKNRKYITDSHVAWVKERRATDPAFRLSGVVSTGVRDALKRVGSSKAGQSTFDHLPYTPQQLKEHLEDQFEPWMSWDNWGNEKGCWNIDHIYPQAKLPYDSMQHPNFQKCWALENLRPLCAIENMRKGDKIL